MGVRRPPCPDGAGRQLRHRRAGRGLQRHLRLSGRIPPTGPMGASTSKPAPTPAAATTSAGPPPGNGSTTPSTSPRPAPTPSPCGWPHPAASPTACTSPAHPAPACPATSTSPRPAAGRPGTTSHRRPSPGAADPHHRPGQRRLEHPPAHLRLSHQRAALAQVISPRAATSTTDYEPNRSEDEKRRLLAIMCAAIVCAALIHDGRQRLHGEEDGREHPLDGHLVSITESGGGASVQQTLRQIVHTSIGGSSAQVQVSNSSAPRRRRLRRTCGRASSSFTIVLGHRPHGHLRRSVHHDSACGWRSATRSPCRSRRSPTSPSACTCRTPPARRRTTSRAR